MIDAESPRSLWNVQQRTELQWGRVVIDAESVALRLARTIVIELQWGRVVIDAESDRKRLKALRTGTLQWGRVVIDAESSTAWSRRTGATSFNGAAS